MSEERSALTGQELVSLANLGRGAAAERFKEELDKVIDNILDPNTTDEAREIKVTVKLKPNEERTYCKTLLSVTSKLAPNRAFGTAIFVGMDGKKVIAVEHDPQQMVLPGVTTEKVRRLEEVK